MADNRITKIEIDIPDVGFDISFHLDGSSESWSAKEFKFNSETAEFLKGLESELESIVQVVQSWNRRQ